MATIHGNSPKVVIEDPAEDVILIKLFRTRLGLVTPHPSTCGAGVGDDVGATVDPSDRGCVQQTWLEEQYLDLTLMTPAPSVITSWVRHLLASTQVQLVVGLPVTITPTSRSKHGNISNRDQMKNMHHLSN